MKYKKIVIGIDQSYSSTGIGISIDGKLIRVGSQRFKGLQTRSEKRLMIRKVLTRLLRKATQEASEVVILCERISTFRKAFGSKKNEQGNNPKYLKMTGALVATIVDIAFEFGVNVYSVDTRSWKSKIVGSSKAKKKKDGTRDAKGDTVKFIEKKGFDLFIREISKGKNKGAPIYDDDAADAGCISLYGFLPDKLQHLQKEE